MGNFAQNLGLGASGFMEGFLGARAERNRTLQAIEQERQQREDEMKRQLKLRELVNAADEAKSQREMQQEALMKFGSPEEASGAMAPGYAFRPEVMNPPQQPNALPPAVMHGGGMTVNAPALQLRGMPQPTTPNIRELSAMAIERQRRQAAQKSLNDMLQGMSDTEKAQYQAMLAGSEAPGGEMYGVDLSGKQALVRDRDLSATKTGREIANMPTQEQARIRNMNATGESFYDLMNKAGRGPGKATNESLGTQLTTGNKANGHFARWIAGMEPAAFNGLMVNKEFKVTPEIIQAAQSEALIGRMSFEDALLLAIRDDPKYAQLQQEFIQRLGAK